MLHQKIWMLNKIRCPRKFEVKKKLWVPTFLDEKVLSAKFGSENFGILNNSVPRKNVVSKRSCEKFVSNIDTSLPLLAAMSSSKSDVVIQFVRSCFCPSPF